MEGISHFLHGHGSLGGLGGRFLLLLGGGRLVVVMRHTLRRFGSTTILHIFFPSLDVSCDILARPRHLLSRPIVVLLVCKGVVDGVSDKDSTPS